MKAPEEQKDQNPAAQGAELTDENLGQAAGGAYVVIHDDGKGFDLRKDDEPEDLGRYDTDDSGAVNPFDRERSLG